MKTCITLYKLLNPLPNWNILHENVNYTSYRTWFFKARQTKSNSLHSHSLELIAKVARSFCSYSHDMQWMKTNKHGFRHEQHWQKVSVITVIAAISTLRFNKWKRWKSPFSTCWNCLLSTVSAMFSSLLTFAHVRLHENWWDFMQMEDRQHVFFNICSIKDCFDVIHAQMPPLFENWKLSLHHSLP